MTIKECNHHQNKRRKRIRSLCAGLLIFLFIVLLTILIIWAILQPKKPRFFLQDATLYALNITTVPNLLSSNFQVTIYARNPNDKIGIYYDKLVAYATYRNQQITYYTAIPSTYQGHKDVNVWSPFVTGTNVPVAPYNGAALSQDQEGGAIRILIKINGRVRWKVGAITTGRYHLHVTCPAYIPFGNSRNKGIDVGTGVKYQVSTSCKVNV